MLSWRATCKVNRILLQITQFMSNEPGSGFDNATSIFGAAGIRSPFHPAIAGAGSRCCDANLQPPLPNGHGLSDLAYQSPIIVCLLLVHLSVSLVTSFRLPSFRLLFFISRRSRLSFCLFFLFSFLLTFFSVFISFFLFAIFVIHSLALSLSLSLSHLQSSLSLRLPSPSSVPSSSVGIHHSSSINGDDDKRTDH